MSENMKAKNRVVAVEPTAAEWAMLAPTQDRDATVDVLVPVYAGRAETLRCLYSVLASHCKTPFNLLVVNDCSPDDGITAELKKLGDLGLIELHELQENIGFVGACNFGMALHPRRDVVLLNSDTEVFSDWLDRLRSAAYSAENIGTVTPFSNNATICSYPRFVEDNWAGLELDDVALDDLAKIINIGETVDIPTGVGFCMYLRRDCLDLVGLFNHEAFGKGYGEENDLSCRVAAAGWRNVLAADTFVRHYGGASFGASKQARVDAGVRMVETLHPGYGARVHDFIVNDPIAPYRRALDKARIARRARSGAVLHVLHNWGGGTEVHVRDLCDILEAQGVSSLVGTVHGGVPHQLTISDPQLSETPNLGCFDIRDGWEEFSCALLDMGIRHVHLHHLAGFVDAMSDFLRLAVEHCGITFDFTVHDYMAACPRINLMDGSGMYCGEPAMTECESCIRRNGSSFGAPMVWQWRDRYARLMADARTVFVPDVDVEERMRRFFPAIDFVVREHPVPMYALPTRRTTVPLRKSVGRRRVALIGALGPSKGSVLLEQVATYVQAAGLPLEFVLVGYSDRDSKLQKLGVTITGKFPRERAEDELLRAEAELVWFSSVWPETYCYTLSAAFNANIYPVAFDFGAIATRIEDAGWGKLLPYEMMLDPEAVAQSLLQCDIPERAFARVAGREYGGNFLENYYGLDWSA